MGKYIDDGVLLQGWDTLPDKLTANRYRSSGERSESEFSVADCMFYIHNTNSSTLEGTSNVLTWFHARGCFHTIASCAADGTPDLMGKDLWKDHDVVTSGIIAIVAAAVRNSCSSLTIPRLMKISSKL